MASHLPFYDGDYTKPVAVGAPIQWNDQVTFAQMTKRTYQQRHNDYAVRTSTPGTVAGGLALGAKDKLSNGFLVDWTEPKDIGGGIVEWDRIFSSIPPKRTEFESFGYTYQYYDTTTLQIVEVPLTARSRVVFTYIKTAQPEKVPLKRAFKLFPFGSQLRFVGDQYSARDTEILGEDEMLVRWKGIIYEKKSRFVPAHPSNRYI